MKPDDISEEEWNAGLKEIGKGSIIFLTRFGNGLEHLGYMIGYLGEDGFNHTLTLSKEGK